MTECGERSKGGLVSADSKTGRSCVRILVLIRPEQGRASDAEFPNAPPTIFGKARPSVAIFVEGKKLKQLERKNQRKKGECSQRCKGVRGIADRGRTFPG